VWVALFSPDGRTVLTGGGDGSARLWDSVTGRPRGIMLGHPGPVVTAAFRPDGKTLATGTAVLDGEKNQFVGGAVRLWDVAVCQPLGQVMPHPGELKGMAFSPDGRTLLTGCVALPPEGRKNPADFKGEARLWDAETTLPLGPPLLHNKPVWAVAFSPDGRTFLTGSEDALARLWLTATQVPIDFPRNQLAGTVRSLAYSPDGQLIATGSAGAPAMARVWTARSARASGTAIPQLTVALSPDGKTILGQGENLFRLWDVVSRKPGPALPPGEKIRAAAFSLDGKTLITAQGRRVEFRNPATGRASLPPWEGLEANQVMADVDGQTLWTVERANGSDVVQRRQFATGKPVGDPLRHPPGLAALAQSDDGRLLLACDTEGVRLWETATGKLLTHHPQQEDWMWTAAFSPGGKTFVAAGRGEIAQLWESATGKPIGPPLPHSSGVLAAAFSRDGHTLLTGCRDGTARLWDVTTGKPLGPPLPHRGAVLRVGFLPGDKEVFTSSESSAGSKEGVTTFWDVVGSWPGPPEQVLLELQVLTGMELDERGAVRKLSADEWQQRRQRLQAPDVPPAPR
jgi:eukaryotic-like serine/threonine-protein kinase